MQQQTITKTTAVKSDCRAIPFEIVSRSSEKMRHVPVTSGLCLSRGLLNEPGDWLVEGLSGAHAPVQTEVLNRWSDGSIRWLLAHFVARRISPGRTAAMLVRPEKRAQHHSGTASLRWNDRELMLTVKPALPEDFAEATVRILPELVAADGQALPLRISEVTEEASGEIRCVTVVQATVIGVPFISLQLRLEIWPGAGLVRAETRIRNTRRAQHKGGIWDLGDAGSYLFQGLHLHVSESHGAATGLSWKAETKAAVRQTGLSDGLSIRQYGSGGPAWANANHIDAMQASPVKERGYCVSSSAGTLRGFRSSPVVALLGENTGLSVAVPEFWQQFPSGLSVADSTISIGLFPSFTTGLFELQGGEQKTLAAWISIAAGNPELSHLDWAYHPPRIVQPADWIRKTKVFDWFTGIPTRTSTQRDDVSERFRRYVQEATSGKWSVVARRERADEYGWRHFGDVHADHEQPHFDGFQTLNSHYNNQFDLIYGGILNLAATGDVQWFDLFEPLARHVMDIDIYHTTEDRACFNGGLFWHTDHFFDARTSTHRTYSSHNAGGDNAYGGGPSCEHNYTSGLLYYHFLTGSREAYEAVVSLADWVIAMDDGKKTIFGLLDSGPTGLASATVFPDFHGPGRGAGNSINALLDGWILTTNDRYLHRAEQLIHRVVHPNHDCEQLQLAEVEGHWSYTVCMNAVGRYLNVKREAGQLDENYAYARASLANYGRWMAASEKPALSQPEQLKYPTVAWAAQEFRKVNALRIAAACTDDAVVATEMHQKADELSEFAWTDLYSFGHMHRTARCLAILLTEGLRDVCHRSFPEHMPSAKYAGAWPEWQMFVPQKQRVKRLLKNPLRVARAVAGLFSPKRILQTVDAVKRHL